MRDALEDCIVPDSCLPEHQNVGSHTQDDRHNTASDLQNSIIQDSWSNEGGQHGPSPFKDVTPGSHNPSRDVRHLHNSIVADSCPDEVRHDGHVPPNPTVAYERQEQHENDTGAEMQSPVVADSCPPSPAHDPMSQVIPDSVDSPHASDADNVMNSLSQEGAS